MSIERKRWIGPLVLSLSCLLATFATAQQEKKAEEGTGLEKQVQKLLDGSLAEQKQAIAVVHKHLADTGAKIGVAEARLAFSVASALEELERRELAAEAFTQFGKDLMRSSDKTIAGFAKLLQGAGRRLGALGKEIEVVGKTPNGKEVNLAKLKGKVVLVDFWATWCGPCVREIPNIKKMYAKYHDKGFEVIGISVDKEKDKLDEFLKEEKLPWPCIYDSGAPEGERLAEYFGVLSIPQAILVDQQGHVVALEARGPELGRLLARLIDKEETEEKK